MHNFIIAGIGVLLELVGYFFYFQDIIKAKINPHPMSWFVWFLTGGIGALIQWRAGAGPAFIVLAVSSVACLSVFLYGFSRSIKDGTNYINYSLWEWASFVLSLVVFVFYLITKDGLTSIILVALVDILAFIPTFIKTWRTPFGEQILLYVVSGLKFIFVLIALEVFSMETAFYPIVLLCANLIFAIFAYLRQRHITRSTKDSFGI